MNFIEELKTELLSQIENFDIKNIQTLSDMIKECNGIIYFTGVGKSGNMAKHCCDLLKSISLKCFYLDPINALHGDIGTLGDQDIVVMFSKSGNTKELLEMVPYIKEKNAKIIGVCCDKQTKFNEICDITIDTQSINEIGGELNNIPTNSCMYQLLFSNILVSILKQNISIDTYKENHPAGKIGSNLTKIKDIISYDYPTISLEDSINVYDILLKMTEKHIGCCFIVDTNNVLVGILTDGDIRRLLIGRNILIPITKQEINVNFYYETNIEKYIYEIPKSYGYIPVLKDNQIIGIFRN